MGAAALAAGCGGGGSSGGTAPPGAPNVLFLAIDDLNDWVGYLGGHPQAITPNLDRLAAASSSFQRAYCNAPLCGPSRASALTGLYPYRTGIFDHSRTQIPRALPDLPRHFERNGYETLVMGKVYHSFTSFENPLPPVFPVTNVQCSGYPVLPAAGIFDWAALDVADEVTADGQMTAAGQAFLDAPRAAPFFLALGYIRTHVPWYVPKRYFDLYDEANLWIPQPPADDWSDLPKIARDIAYFQNQHACITGQNLWRSAVRGYLASISFVDAQIGKILAALDRSRHADNTIVVLWSDNGFHLGEKFHWHKQSLWEESARVPFLIRRPGRAGARIDRDVSLVDMFPTLSQLCGVPRPAELHGHSLLPLMDNPGMPWDHPVLTTYLRNHHAIRQGRWCYIRYEDGTEELYDRLTDGDQLNNLAADPRWRDVKLQLGSLMPAPV